MQSKFADTAKHFSRVAAALLNSGARSAVLYLSPTRVVRACRPVYRSHPGVVEDRDYMRADIIFTAGEPNYEAKQFIRKCKKAGEPFPIKKIQLKFAS